MYTDYHCHMLPEIDDGAESIEDSLKMIVMEYQQNVRSIAFTPHYYRSEESITSFLRKRSDAYNSLNQYLYKFDDMTFTLGAEVLLAKNISRDSDLKQLCYGNTDYMLIEMPYESIQKWMIEEIEEIIYSHSIIPVFAHVDRYISIYNKKEYKLLFSIKEAVFQINNKSIEDKKFMKLLKKIASTNLYVVFGSDAHNLKSRPPNFDIINNSKNITEKQLNLKLF